MIEFYLLAEKNADGSLSVREFYQFISADFIKNARGEMVPRVHIEGRVDDDIRRENAEPYKAFRAWVDNNEVKVYGLCRDNVGVKVFMPSCAEEVKEEKKEEVKPKRGRKILVKE